MRSFGAGLLTIFVCGALVAPTGAQRPSPAPAPTRLQLTVDSIMRGPELVGWPPTQLRWSPDSRHLFFSWRKPGDKVEALYVVARDGGAPRKLSDEEAGNAPPANGRWDAAKRRLLATESGDVEVAESLRSASAARGPQSVRPPKQDLRTRAAGRGPRIAEDILTSACRSTSSTSFAVPVRCSKGTSS
jgi:hypothetical protein